MSKSQIDQEQAEAIERLRAWVQPGDKVFTILRHRSRSGMARVIQIIKIEPESNSPIYLGYNVAKALGWKYDNDYEGVKVGGAGMDMGFHLVYSLSRVLFRDNFTCIGPKCPSNDHTNGMRRPAEPDATIKHSDGGYALRSEWL